MGKAVDKQRCQELASQYCRLRSLNAVGKIHGLTREGVRQILIQGHRNGWCVYSPRVGQCAVLPLIAELSKTSTTWTQFSSAIRKRTGVADGTLIKLLARVGISRDRLIDQFSANRLSHYMNRFYSHAVRLGVETTFHTTTIQRDPQARVAYSRLVDGYGLGIQEIRKYFSTPFQGRRCQS